MSGCIDYFVEDEFEVFMIGRNIVEIFLFYNFCISELEFFFYDVNDILGFIFLENNIDIY